MANKSRTIRELPSVSMSSDIMLHPRSFAANHDVLVVCKKTGTSYKLNLQEFLTYWLEEVEREDDNIVDDILDYAEETENSGRNL